MIETLTQAVARFSTRSYLSTGLGINLSKDAQFLLSNDSTYEMKLDARRMPKLCLGLDSMWRSNCAAKAIHPSAAKRQCCRFVR